MKTTFICGSQPFHAAPSQDAGNCVPEIARPPAGRSPLSVL